MPQEEQIWPPWMWTVLRIAGVLAIVVVSFVARTSADDDDEPRADYAPVYDAEFPVNNKKILRVGTDVYYFHDAVGEIVATKVEGDRLHVSFTIHPDFQDQFTAMPSSLTSYQSDKFPDRGWITVVPETEDGKELTPKEAAEQWGTGT